MTTIYFDKYGNEQSQPFYQEDRTPELDSIAADAGADNDLFLGLYDQVKPGDKISFITGPGESPEYPAFQGIAYGKQAGRFGRTIRVKIQENGQTRFEYVSGFTEVGIGAYYLGK